MKMKKINLSSVMKDAHKRAKSFVGDYRARISQGLKEAWENAKKTLSVGYSSKVSFDKVERETEKALLVELWVYDKYDKVDKIKEWVPKSAVIFGNELKKWIVSKIEEKHDYRFELLKQLF